MMLLCACLATIGFAAIEFAGLQLFKATILRLPVVALFVFAMFKDSRELSISKKSKTRLKPLRLSRKVLVPPPFSGSPSTLPPNGMLPDETVESGGLNPGRGINHLEKCGSFAPPPGIITRTLRLVAKTHLISSVGMVDRTWPVTTRMTSCSAA